MTTEVNAVRPRRVAFLHSGAFFHLATLADPAVKAMDVVDVYAPDMDEHSLDQCDALFLAARHHPDVIQKIAPYIIEFLNKPGVKVYVDGENHVDEWLPGTAEAHRGTNFWAWRIGEDVGRRSVNKEHPMWAYLDDFALHWHYHGVLEPPKDATPLVVLEELESAGEEERKDPWGGGYLAIPGHANVLAYHDDSTFAAELVVTTMDCAYHHGSGFMPGATALLYRMLAWLRD